MPDATTDLNTQDMRMNQFLTLYENTLMSTGIPRIEEKFERSTVERRLSHIRWMIDDIQHGPDRSEAYRFIQFGLIQGGLWAEHIFAPHVLLEHRELLLEAVGSTQ